MMRFFTGFLIAFSIFAQAQQNPPGSTPPSSCIDLVKSYLSSSEYNSDESNAKILSACIDVDARCVQLVGDSLNSGERSEAANFLPLVKNCTGRGKADCYSAILETTPSFDRSTAAQASNLMKKCERQ